MSYLRSKPLILLISLLALMSLTTSLAVAAPPAQDPDSGKAFWESDKNSCKRCHGDDGTGLWSGPLAGNDKTAAEWIEQVRTPRKRMPSYSEAQISDETITNLHAYLTALPAPAGEFAPMSADLPADAPAGQRLLDEKKCVPCHTTGGPMRGFNMRGEMPTAEAVIKQLRTPKENMPSYSAEQVSDEEAAKITEFLVTQYSPTTSEPAVPPTTLPTSGGDYAAWPVLLALIGGTSLLAGLLLRRRLLSS